MSIVRIAHERSQHLFILHHRGLSTPLTLRTPYERGRSAEYAVKRMLQDQGYRWVIRSAASHSPVDLLASNGVETLAVQCKVGGYISPEEKVALIQWAAKLNAHPCLARKNRSRRWILLRVDEVNVLDLFEVAA